MAYVHRNRAKVICTNDPIDQDSTDWVYFSYQDWLRENETITTYVATIDGGTIVTASPESSPGWYPSEAIGTVRDSLGDDYTDSYGVQFSVTAGVTKVTITHRVTSTVTGSPDLGRINIDHTVVIPVVREL